MKFSGLRSSGRLLFTPPENGILDARRSDVIPSNDTAAEHPATYEFVAKCKRLAESRYGIPFFLAERRTYEDVRNGEWTRRGPGLVGPVGPAQPLSPLREVHCAADLHAQPRLLSLRPPERPMPVWLQDVLHHHRATVRFIGQAVVGLCHYSIPPRSARERSHRRFRLAQGAGHPACVALQS